MTLQEHMHLGYRYEMHREIADPMPDCARDIPKVEIAAEIARLQPIVERRDHISTIWQRFLRRCLGNEIRG